MCGISAVLTVSRQRENGISTDDITCLKRRGPDAFHSHSISIFDDAEITFSSSVLHMRGKEIIFQPAMDENKNILLWNGEIFGGSKMQLEESDTKHLLKQLSQAETDQALLYTMGLLQGPWAFIYWQAHKRSLWFGRDILGRRSLLWGCGSSTHVPLVISSLATRRNKINSWKEVPAAGIYCFHINDYNKGNIILNLHPWKNSVSGATVSLDNECLFENWKIVVSSTIKSPIVNILNQSIPVEEDLFCYSVLHDKLETSMQLNESKMIDKTPDLNMFYQRADWQRITKQFFDALNTAIQLRVKNHLFLCSDCYKIPKEQHPMISSTGEVRCIHASVAVLFSGGLDSVIIASLTDRHLPEHIPVDLLNVAFEHEKKCDNIPKQTVKAHAKGCSSVMTYDSPDRISGKNAWKELQSLSPSRTWNFVEINVTRKELQAEREKHICNLIYPSVTVLDDSIGCACWFGSRGKGYINSNGISVPYTSPAKVILVGMGADEQLAGYSRHRNKFNFLGWNGLLKEIEMEIDRISSRNLGRDDRVISDLGREMRLPFLDENVISFLNSLPIWLKANLSLSRGIGEKFLLRLLAVHLGLNSVATLPKRAIQFGSRIAHSEEKKEKGSDDCIRLKR